MPYLAPARAGQPLSSPAMASRPSAVESSVFLRFLNLAKAVRELPNLPGLDPMEERLLQELGTLWYEGTKVPVVRAMELFSSGSPSTAHRRLKALRQKGFVGLEPDAHDGRIKYVVATPECLRYFQRLGQAMAEAVAPTPCNR